MGTGSKGGPVLVLRAFRQILVDHLQGYVDEIVTEVNAAGIGDPIPAAGDLAVKAPIADGYTLSRAYGKATRSACAIYVEETEILDEWYNINAFRRSTFTVIARFQYATKAYPAVEEPLLIISRAAVEMVMRYWRAYAAQTCLQNVTPITRDAVASFREKDQIFGFVRTGRDVRNTNEQNEIAFRCVQAVEALISYDP